MLELYMYMKKIRDAKNIFEAISIGATNVIKPIAGIITNLIAFIAIFAFIDSTVIWVFSLVGVENFGITVKKHYNIKNTFYRLINKVFNIL